MDINNDFLDIYIYKNIISNNLLLLIKSRLHNKNNKVINNNETNKGNEDIEKNKIVKVKQRINRMKKKLKDRSYIKKLKFIKKLFKLNMKEINLENLEYNNIIHKEDEDIKIIERNNRNKRKPINLSYVKKKLKLIKIIKKPNVKEDPLENTMTIKIKNTNIANTKTLTSNKVANTKTLTSNKVANTKTLPGNKVANTKTLPGNKVANTKTLTSNNNTPTGNNIANHNKRKLITNSVISKHMKKIIYDKKKSGKKTSNLEIIDKKIITNMIEVGNIYNYFDKINSFNKFYLTKTEEVMSNPKIEFRYFCYRYLNYLKSIKIPEIPTKSKYEAVLIEFRCFPHIEFIIRNNILKLGSNWSYTIICGNLNYNFIIDMCKEISNNIKIIKLDYDNVLPSIYSNILSSINFWNLFEGEKILIHQEDSIIFKSNIENFINWDYIGAPWPKTQNDNLNNVGNGGFSLRNKQCMIDVINKISITDTKYNESTLQYMKNTQSKTAPEDVYFSKNMLDFNIGSVADWNTAFNFSSESLYNPESLGGHCYWTNYKLWKLPLFKNIIIQVKRNSNFRSDHRGGWNSIINELNKNIISNDAKLIFLDIIEDYFMWKKNNVINNLWCGIIHCTTDVPNEWASCNISILFNNLNFMKSIKNCKFIITLSNNVKEYLDKKFNEININIPVIFIKHPINFNNILKFDIDAYINNENKKLIQIGQQLRKISSIFEVKIENHQKLWLTGMSNLLAAEMKLKIDYNIIKKNLPNNYKNLFTYLKDVNEYDKLLENNIVFLDLYNSAANNTILECITRNTPVIVNRTIGVIEYLGNDYPLYFDNLDQVNDLLDIEKIKSANEYLKNMNKEDITMEYFIDKFIKCLFMYN
jgi:hypothetical protein